ncbi:hypothetical protein EDC94DRAFT_644082 [Helicostylum pulchrum]|nr:hypothetical protein EDC94DRAFT_644082 [Helicostylum pulchrum]
MNPQEHSRQVKIYTEYANYYESDIYFNPSTIIIKGKKNKEKSSPESNNATDSKGKLSLIEEITESSASEISKDLPDGYYKLLIVMKDEVIVDKYANLRNDVSIIGYNVQGTESSNWQYICINMSGDYAYSRNMQRIDTLERPRIFFKRNEFPLDSPDYTIVRRHKIMCFKREITSKESIINLSVTPFNTANSKISGRIQRGQLRLQMCQKRICPFSLNSSKNRYMLAMSLLPQAVDETLQISEIIIVIGAYRTSKNLLKGFIYRTSHW